MMIAALAMATSLTNSCTSFAQALTSDQLAERAIAGRRPTSTAGIAQCNFQ
jgi:hypothetical protein